MARSLHDVNNRIFFSNKISKEEKRWINYRIFFHNLSDEEKARGNLSNTMQPRMKAIIQRPLHVTFVGIKQLFTHYLWPYFFTRFNAM